jgi:small subunit ribosomal protein S17e
MGRIKTSKIKRVTKEVMKEYEFTEDFTQNKEKLNGVITVSSKKLRNIIAGYITRLTKSQEKL